MTIHRFQTKLDQILNLLVDRGEEGATNKELSNIALNYTSPLSTLHKQGHVIQCVQMGESGTYKYILRKQTSSIKYHPSAYEDAVNTLYTQMDGSLHGEEGLIELLRLTGNIFARKHGYYKEQMASEYEQFDEQMKFDLD